MDARKLVGMTQGARKRKAREWMECERLHQRMQDARDVVDCQMGRGSPPRTVGHTPEQLKQHYRIGQRLRPCPGCRKCGYEPTVKLWRLSRDAMWMSGSLGVRDIRNICDGSGVIPAKARKVRR